MKLVDALRETGKDMPLFSGERATVLAGAEVLQDVWFYAEKMVRGPTPEEKFQGAAILGILKRYEGE